MDTGARTLFARHGLDPEPTPAARDEALRWAGDPGIDAPDLADLTHVPFVTVDEAHSRDLDQALAIEAEGDGYRVWYALADASWYVRPGTALFDEALARGASYYLPGAVAPMLPPLLSEDLVSLGPAVDRRAVVFEIGLDAEGATRSIRVRRARIRSRYKLDFDGVQAFLDGAEVTWTPDVRASLSRLPEVGLRRAALAAGRDVVRYRRAELEVKAVGGVFVAFDGPRNAVERHNEQLSVLVNAEGARLLAEGDTPHDEVHPVFRVHEPPSPDRLVALADATREIAALHARDASWVWSPDREGLAAYLDRLPDDAVGRAIHRQAMVTNRPSRHAASPGVHHGVGVELYARFTAPMREIVGIFLHGELALKLGWVGAPAPGDHGEALREAVIAAANRANEVQRALDREANRLVLDAMFTEDLANGRARPGVVLGVTAGKVHVQLASPAVDVKAYTADLARRWGPLALSGSSALVDAEGAVRVAVGDEVEVRVLARDPARDRWALDLVAPRRA